MGGALESARERLFAAIDGRAEETADLVGDLVRFPSTLGNEGPAQAFVADHLRESGLDAECWEIGGSIQGWPNAGVSGVAFAERPNVSARLRGRGGGRSLVLNGHVDVVSAAPLDAWATDPFSPTRVGDRLYGRGAWDMKSGLAINLMLPRLLRDAGIELAGDLVVQSVIEEECTGNGALAAARRDRADAALITESTNQRFTRAHVGVAWFSVTITGKSAHAAWARRGVNAIEKSVPVIAALRQLDAELNEESHPLYAGIDHPINLNVGVIHAGDWPSTVPGEARIDCRVSFYPGGTMAELRSRIESAVAGVAATDHWLREHPPRVTYHGFGSEGSVVDVEHPFVQHVASWHERVAGERIEWDTSTGICDMKAFNLAGIPCGCYGARGGNAHGADEWLDLTSLAPTMKVVGGAVLDWCGVAGAA